MKKFVFLFLSLLLVLTLFIGPTSLIAFASTENSADNNRINPVTGERYGISTAGSTTIVRKVESNDFKTTVSESEEKGSVSKTVPVANKIDNAAPVTRDELSDLEKRVEILEKEMNQVKRHQIELFILVFGILCIVIVICIYIVNKEQKNEDN